VNVRVFAIPVILPILAHKNDFFGEPSSTQAAGKFKVMLKVDRVLDVAVVGRPMLPHHAQGRDQ